jgi:hypothetical protein
MWNFINLITVVVKVVETIVQTVINVIQEQQSGTSSEQPSNQSQEPRSDPVAEAKAAKAAAEAAAKKRRQMEIERRERLFEDQYGEDDFSDSPYVTADASLIDAPELDTGWQRSRNLSLLYEGELYWDFLAAGGTTTSFFAQSRVKGSPRRDSEALRKAVFPIRLANSISQNPETPEAYLDLITSYGVTFTSDALDEFDLHALENIYAGTTATAEALWDLYENGDLAAFVDRGTFETQEELFVAVMGNINLNFIDDPTKKYGAEASGQNITIYPYAEASTPKFEWNIVHEFGHVLASRMFGYAQSELALTGLLNLEDLNAENPDMVLVDNPNFDPARPADASTNPRQIWARSDRGLPSSQGGISPQNRTPSYDEAWADMFLYWVYGEFDSTQIGRNKETATNRIMTAILNTQYGLALDDNELQGQISGDNFGIVRENNVNVRAAPTTRSNSFGLQLSQGAAVEILGSVENGQWLLVVTGDGRISWVSSGLIDTSQSSDIPPLNDADITRLTGRS